MEIKHNYPGIYRIINVINGKSYIGKSNNIDRRFSDHLRAAKNSKRDADINKPLYRAIKKYGYENFIVYPIERFKNDQDYFENSDKREIYWIKYYRTYIGDSRLFGYNGTIGGDGGRTSVDSYEKQGVLTKEEIYYLRERYKECKYPSSVIYEKEFKSKISKRGFQAIWLGENGRHIHEDVFTEENRKKQYKLVRAYEGCLRRRKKISFEENKAIREERKNGLSWIEIYKKHHLENKYKSPDSFCDVMRKLALDEEIDIYGELEPISN